MILSLSKLKINIILVFCQTMEYKLWQNRHDILAYGSSPCDVSNPSLPPLYLSNRMLSKNRLLRTWMNINILMVMLYTLTYVLIEDRLWLDNNTSYSKCVTQVAHIVSPEILVYGYSVIWCICTVTYYI